MKIKKNQKLIRKFIIILSLLVLISINISCNSNYIDDNDESRDNIVNLIRNSEKGIYETRDFSPKEEIVYTEDQFRHINTEITLSFVGDTILQKNFLNSIYNPSDKYYDFNSAFQYIRKDIVDSDFTTLCLETIFYNSPNSEKAFSPDQFADTLKNLDIDLVALANNHALDGGQNGIIKTIGVLDSMNISHVGTNKTVDDYLETQGTIIKNINNIKVGFMNLTKYTSGIELPKENIAAVNVYTTDYLSNFQYNIDYDKISNQINYLKNNNVEIIIAILHWGSSNNQDPSDQQIELANFLVTNGVKIIIGSHPHVVQTAIHETLGTLDKSDDFFVVYSLGNFFSISSNKNNNMSAILNIKIKRENQVTFIDDISYKPITIISRDRSQFPRYILLNTVDCLNNLQTFENPELLQYMSKIIVDQLILTYKKLTSTWPPEYEYYAKNNLIQYDNSTFSYNRLKDLYNDNAYRNRQ